jgi:hypothetical protein
MNQPKTITMHCNENQLDQELSKLSRDGYLVTDVSDYNMESGKKGKKIEAKHKNAVVRPGLEFVD